MGNLKALIYTSSAVNHEIKKIELILADSRVYNLKHGITGVLLYSHGAFLQYLEGDENELSAVYTRIKESSSHKNVNLIIYTNIVERSFPDWLMGFGELTKSEMLSLSTTQWQNYNKSLEEKPTPNQPYRAPQGFKLIQTFWMVAQSRIESMKMMQRRD